MIVCMYGMCVYIYCVCVGAGRLMRSERKIADNSFSKAFPLLQHREEMTVEGLEWKETGDRLGTRSGSKVLLSCSRMG